jgi:hypothetical protein
MLHSTKANNLLYKKNPRGERKKQQVPSRGGELSEDQVGWLSAAQ